MSVEDLPGKSKLCFLSLDRNGWNKSTTRKLGWNNQFSAEPPERGALGRVPSVAAAAAAQGPAGREFPPFPTPSLPRAGIRGLNKHVPM